MTRHAVYDKAEQVCSLTRQMSREQVVASIREDYDQTYFFTGSADMEAYEPDCLFADPFTSFRGVQRFRKNVSNLGGLL